MKKTLLILLLLPCFCQAQTSTDTIIADTTTRKIVIAMGSVNLDTMKVAINTVECFHYVLSAFSKQGILYAVVDYWVSNVDGVYNVVKDAGSSPTMGMGNPSPLGANKVGNLIILQYIKPGTTVFTWRFTKTKTSL